ncbi:unnamed protein product [Anisakis simplex]|uniref:Subfamily S9B unassigned peptidase (inferred by orthology to a S. mansoni protein) n=1 Tax=Anisakis simplex TaxID=6269 RepID=A0A0M3J1V7_ANISI|nr:unnamed protein product [Anisakis simplex]
MLVPSDFDTNIGYTVVVSLYGGPGSQNAMEYFGPTDFHESLVSSEKHIVIYIDGRGTGLRGWNYKEPIYGQLSTVEIDDQIEIMSTLAKKYDFIDSSRIAIWGWSYGGFATAHVIEHDNERTFKCGVSVFAIIFRECFFTVESYASMPSYRCLNSKQIARGRYLPPCECKCCHSIDASFPQFSNVISTLL